MCLAETKLGAQQPFHVAEDDITSWLTIREPAALAVCVQLDDIRAMDGLERELSELVKRYGLPPAAKDQLASLVREHTTHPPPFASSSVSGSTESSPAASRDRATHGLGLQPTRYEGRTPLGAGSMGEVFRVRDCWLNRLVAVKVLRPKGAGGGPSMARFVTEAQVTAQLQHPGIVPVYEIGALEDGRPYFTMREVRGRTLRKAIESVHAASSGGRWESDSQGWSLRRLLEALQSACEAVAYAHDRGVIHRDIKPGNIMVGDYGEVLVLDWGVAKILAEPTGTESEPSVVTADRTKTKSGVIAGTLAYMAPEQALGQPATFTSDVFSLGAVLFEILCNRPPFGDRIDTTSGTGESASLHVSPEPDFPGELPIAEELKAICRRALAYDPRSRYENAGALASDIAAWLEGAKSRARAEGILSEAAKSLAEVEQLRDKARSLKDQARQILTSMPSFLEPKAKEPGWELEDRAAELEHQADIQTVTARQNVRAALTHDPDLREAHAVLAAHYFKEHQRAEDARNNDEANRLAVLIRDHDDGEYAAYLNGAGALSIVTDPPGAHVRLHKYELRERHLQLGPAQALGTTPIQAQELAMGSYLLILEAEGRQPVRYPVSIRRQEHWDGVPPGATESEAIYLPRSGELDPDECYVPAGWFWSGGDDTQTIGRRSILPRRRVWVDAFVMRQHHVTIGEYVEFLNALVADGREQEALVAAPRSSGQQQELGQLLLEREGNGNFFIPTNNYFGIPWKAEWPVIFVDWYGAAAYAKWKASIRDRPYRLPMEFEWEKAARGVDGRRYPWGDFLDPTWCRMLETHASFPTMAPAGSYPIDESPYGVRDAAGNQRDWCLDVPSEQGPPLTESGRLIGYPDSHEAWNVREVRGGNFLDSPLMCWSYHRVGVIPNLRDYIISFRTARSMNGQYPKAISPPGHAQ